MTSSSQRKRCDSLNVSLHVAHSFKFD
uniref:Uncharacterized protein n=1 Tax=Arundo donax TaxID=35708 RepID=A0A0A8ZI55_ARUDO